VPESRPMFRPAGSPGLFGNPSAQPQRAARDTDVLFVCTGNICRSPLAEKLLRSFSEGGLRVSSAGTGALVGAGMDAWPAHFAEAWTGDSSHTARQITQRHIDTSELILTMTRTQRSDVVRMVPSAQNRVFTLAEFDRRLREARAGKAPLAELARLAARTRLDVPEDDVEDPFRRSDETHRKVALRIRELTSATAERIAV
jgi:protein-tyrosine phosphatase